MSCIDTVMVSQHNTCTCCMPMDILKHSHLFLINKVFLGKAIGKVFFV